MIMRFRSTPPHTLGIVRPAFSATSMNWTGDAGDVETAAFTCHRSPSFHNGVVRVSSRLLLSMNSEDPRKRRRGMIIGFFDYRKSSGLERVTGRAPWETDAERFPRLPSRQ